MNPSKVDITMSMIEREIMNIAGKFGYGDNHLVKLAIEYGKTMYGDKARALIASITESDETMEVGADVLKESVSGCIDNFSERLKQKLNENGAQSGRNTPETQA